MELGMVELVLVAVVGVMLLLLQVGVQRWRERGSRNPRTWPLLGAQLEVWANVGRIHDWCVGYFAEDHQTVTIRLLSGLTLHLTVHPPNLHHLLKSNFHNYPKGERLNSCLHDFLGTGIFNSDGDTWKRHRKIASSEFSNRRLREFSAHAFREGALNLLHILHSTTATNSPIDIQDLFLRMTMDSICKIGFGMDLGCLSPSLPDVAFGKSFDIVNEAISSRVMNPFWKLQKLLSVGNEKILKENMKSLNDFTSRIIQKRRMEMHAANLLGKNEERVDLLSRFMACDHALGTKSQYTDEELRDSILNFIIAGRDTTAITLAWFIYCICKHPEVGERIFKESLEVLDLQEESHALNFEEFAERVNYESLGKMHYLHAALTETLRLYPAVPRDGKTVLHDDILPDGTCVKKGDQVSYVPYSMGRMEFLWGRDALVYNPDRWLKDGIFQPESPFKFSAFQAGARICLGKEFAYLQMKMTTVLLLHFFKFNMVEGHEVHYRVMMVMAMSNGLQVNVSCR